MQTNQKLHTHTQIERENEEERVNEEKQQNSENKIKTNVQNCAKDKQIQANYAKQINIYPIKKHKIRLSSRCD